MADISKIKTPDGTTYDISVNHDHAIKSGQTIYNVANYCNHGSAMETIIYTGIKFVSSTHMPLVRLKGYAYGKGKTTELIVALYIYQNAFYSSRTVTNLGVWTPDVYLFTYEKNSTKYVAIGLAGSIYYNMFSVDVQDEMGQFRNIDRDGWTISSYTEAGTIPAVGTDDCVSVDYGINILYPPNAVEADTALLSADNGDTSMKIHPQSNNEINFGGTGNSSTIYVGCRARDSKPIPTKFVFGGVNGTSDLQAKTVYLGSGTSSYITANLFTGSVYTVARLATVKPDTIDSFKGTEFKIAPVTGTTITGLAGNDGMLVWIPFNAKYGRQLIFDDTTHKVFSRYLNNDAWGAWKDLTDAETVNGHTVNSDVPANAKFTDTTYSGTSPISINSSNQVSIATASTSAYGATKLSTATNSTAVDVAATPSAVKTAYDLANSANGTANTALSGVNGNLIYDQTFTISNGVATFTPHVYQKGQEVTTNYAKSCFVWKYRLVDGSEVSLTTNDNRGCTVTISGMGYGGHVIGAFTPS